MRLLSWNVNGIRAIHKKGFLDWLRKEEPDILCLQETKAQAEQFPKELLELDDYHVYSTSAEKKGYSGVAILSKKEPEMVEHGLGIDRFDIEGRTIIAHYETFVLLNIYFPNGKSSGERLQYKMDFYNAFLEFVDSLTAAGKSLVICGDVNTAHTEIDLARPKENEKVSGFLPEERAWIDTFLSHGYDDTFRVFNSEGEHYSWWDYKTRARERNVGWRIDYFFTSQKLSKKLTGATILSEVIGSDHCPVSIDLEA